MGFFKREAKKFDYKPRFYEGEGNPYEIGHKLDKFRTTTGKNKNLKAKFSSAFDDLKDIRSNGANKTILYIIAFFLLLFLFFIEFDLSIFLPQN